MSTQLRRVASFAACAATALLATASTAYAIGGGFDPTVTEPVYPGSSRTVDVWKATGTHGPPITEGASLTLVAPRWVIASEHAGVATSQTFMAPDGRTSRVLAYYEPSIPGEYKTNGDFGPKPAADISLSLLETAMPAPATGFPKLLEDPVSTTVADSLPGYVLWAGHGGSFFAPTPSVQWALPHGAPAPGANRIDQIPGDSGSAGFYFPTATSAPLITETTSYAGSYPPLGSGRHTTLSDPVGTTIQGNYATVKDWLKAMMARHPEAAPPTWTTLEREGVRMAEQRPAPPSDVRVTVATPSAIAIAWTKPAPTGAPRTGFQVRVTPTPTTGKSTYDLGDVSTFALTSGLEIGKEYAFTVQAVGPNGVSVLRNEHTVRYLMRSAPSAAQDVRLTSSRVFEDGRVRYCARLSWLPSSTSPDTAVTRYDVTFDGLPFDQQNPFLTPGADGRLGASRCGYDRSQHVTASVRATSDKTKGPVTSLSGVVSAVELPQDLPQFALTTRRAIRNARADYCVKAAWTAPTAPDGSTLGGITVAVVATDFSEVLGNEEPLAPASTSYEQCGLSPATEYVVTVQQAYGTAGRWLSAMDMTATLPGASPGTLIPAASIGSATGVVGSVSGSPSLCADVAWSAPPSVDGFPVTGYQVVLSGGSPTKTKLSPVLGADARSARVCGLNPGAFTAYLSTKYAAGAVSPATVTLTVS